jgi:hypothetical protein
MYMKPVRSRTSWHQRALERQPLNPSVHRNVQGIIPSNSSDRSRNVTRNVNTPHDPDLLDLGRKDVRLVGGRHGASSIVPPPQVEKRLKESACHHRPGELPWHSHSWLCASTKSHSFNSGTECFRRANDFFRNLFSRAASASVSIQLSAVPLVSFLVPCRAGLAPPGVNPGAI